jgi:hypothetical protein
MGLSCVAAAGVASAETPSEPQEQFTCTQGAVKRLISIYRDAGQTSAAGCHVEYTKEGRSRTVWSATSKSGYPYCIKKALTLVTALTRSHYECRPHTGQSAEDGGSP